MKKKLLGTAYINLIESDGEVKFEYGYELDKVNVSLKMLKLKANRDRMFLFT